MLNISSNDAEKRVYSQVITFADDEQLFSLVEGQTLQIQMANYPYRISFAVLINKCCIQGRRTLNNEITSCI